MLKYIYNQATMRKKKLIIKSKQIVTKPKLSLSIIASIFKNLIHSNII